MKTLDTKSFLSALCEAAEEGKTVSTVVTGGSMSPFLCGGRDYVFLEKPRKKLKKGDIVLFLRENGDFVLHRITKIRKDGYYLSGDRQTASEGPINEGQIRCVAVKVRRKGKILTPKNIRWKFYSLLWPKMMFLRPAIFALFAGKGKKPK